MEKLKLIGSDVTRTIVETATTLQKLKVFIHEAIKLFIKWNLEYLSIL